MIDTHAPVPQMEFLEQQRIDLEKVEGGRIGHAHELEIAHQDEEIVQREALLAHLVLVAAVSRAVQNVAEDASKRAPSHATSIPLRCVCVLRLLRGRAARAIRTALTARARAAKLSH